MTESRDDTNNSEQVATPEPNGLLISTNHYTPEQHKRILARSAEYPGLDKALTEGDEVYAEFLERVRSGELSRSPGSTGTADS